MQSPLRFLASHRKCRNRSSGLTVIDLVISLSLAGILLSLLIPAILRSIERSRQITCRSNLRQVGMAAQQHVSTRRSFPLTSTAWSEGGEIHRALSPHQSLMAFIDRNMFDQIDSTDPFQPAWENSPVSFVSASNRSLANVSPGIFRCPSDSVPLGGSSYRANLGISVQILPPSVSVESDSQRGAFVNGRAVSAAEFRDGLSNTVLFSERVAGDFAAARYDAFRDSFGVPGAAGFTTETMNNACRQSASWDPAKEFSFSGGTWLLGGYCHTWYNHVRAPNSRDPDCAIGSGFVDGGPSIVTARSFHGSGVNVTMADGSSNLVAETIAVNIWRAMGTRNGTD